MTLADNLKCTRITRAKGILINGQKQGLWNEFTDDGDIATQCEYINDTINGECFGYFNSGKLMINGFYKKGLKDSMWTFYHENGKLWKQGKFKLDKQAGVWKHYYASGTLAKQKSY